MLTPTRIQTEDKDLTKSTEATKGDGFLIEIVGITTLKKSRNPERKIRARTSQTFLLLASCFYTLKLHYFNSLPSSSSLSHTFLSVTVFFSLILASSPLFDVSPFVVFF